MCVSCSAESGSNLKRRNSGNWIDPTFFGHYVLKSDRSSRWAAASKVGQGEAPLLWAGRCSVITRKKSTDDKNMKERKRRASFETATIKRDKKRNGILFPKEDLFFASLIQQLFLTAE